MLGKGWGPDANANEPDALDWGMGVGVDDSRSVIEPGTLCWGVDRGLTGVVLHKSLNGPLAFLYQLQRPHFFDLHHGDLHQQLPTTQQHVAQLPLHWQANVAGLKENQMYLHS